MADFPIIPGEAFTSEQLAMLDAPLSMDTIKERIGAGGKKLKYIDGKTAIDTANRIFGRGKWGFRIVARTHEKVEYKDGSHKEYFTADIELYVSGNPFPFPGDGIGALQSPTVEGIEMARKDAVTDGLKRALCYYGDQFGLALRDEDALVEVAEGVTVKVNEVQVNKNGANTVKPSAAARVNAAANRPQIAAPANNAKVVDSQPPTPKLAEQSNNTEKAPAPPVTTLRTLAMKRIGEGAFDKLKAKMQAVYKETDLSVDDAWSERICQHAYAMLKRDIEAAKQQPAMAS